MTDNPSAGTQYHVMVDPDAYTAMSEFTPAPSNATSCQDEAVLEAEFIRILTSQGYDNLAVDSEPALISNLREQVEALTSRRRSARSTATSTTRSGLAAACSSTCSCSLYP